MEELSHGEVAKRTYLFCTGKNCVKKPTSPAKFTIIYMYLFINAAINSTNLHTTTVDVRWSVLVCECGAF